MGAVKAEHCFDGDLATDVTMLGRPIDVRVRGTRV
jgi:hypothetical protein